MGGDGVGRWWLWSRVVGRYGAELAHKCSERKRNQSGAVVFFFRGGNGDRFGLGLRWDLPPPPSPPPLPTHVPSLQEAPRSTTPPSEGPSITGTTPPSPITAPLSAAPHRLRGHPPPPAPIFSPPAPLPPSVSPPRGCTDVLCCVLLLLAVLGYVAVGIVGTWGGGGVVWGREVGVWGWGSLWGGS